MKRHHTAVAATTALVLVVSGGTAAFAHVEPEPTEIPPGTAATVTFTAEEECPVPGTTGMLFEIPTGITDLLPVDKEGWTTAAGDDTVGFERDDPAADDLTFQLSFTAPAAEGTIDFPVVQQCGDGSEVRWIEIPVEGQPEPENPAPQLDVVEGAPPATTVVPPPTTAPVETTTAPTTTAAPETTPAPTTTAAPETTVAPETTAAPETTVAETTTTVVLETTVAPTATIAEEDDDGSNTGLIIGLIALAIALAGLGAYVLSRRSKAGPGTAAGAATMTGAAAAGAAGDDIPPGATAPTTVLPVTDPTGVTPADAPLPPIVPAPEPPTTLPPPPGEVPPPPPPPGPDAPQGPAS